MLDGELGNNKPKKGNIDLPLALAPDYINRPMQMVAEVGKPAQAVYEVIEVADGLTRVNFYPITVSHARRNKCARTTLRS